MKCESAMTREDIEKAAAEYCSIKPYKEFVLNKNAFIAGAEWCISIVWHDPSEVPEDNTMIFVFDINRHSVVVLVFSDRWKETVLIFGIIKWAYVKDLILNMEE